MTQDYNFASNAFASSQYTNLIFKEFGVVFSGIPELPISWFDGVPPAGNAQVPIEGPARNYYMRVEGPDGVEIYNERFTHYYSNYPVTAAPGLIRTDGLRIPWMGWDLNFGQWAWGHDGAVLEGTKIYIGVLPSRFGPDVKARQQAKEYGATLRDRVSVNKPDGSRRHTLTSGTRRMKAE
ncbi:MAG: hypothetical protein ACR2NL_06880 [Acidimicrobiia bacterium]